MADIQPMTDERWAEIQRLAAFGTPPDALPSSSALARMIEDLVDEVERLRAEIYGWEQVVDDERSAREIAQERHGNLLGVKSRLELRIEELEEENAAMRPIVEAVALREMFTPTYPPAGPSLYRCQWCHATGRNQSRFKHHEDCQVVNACTILGIKPSESEA